MKEEGALGEEDWNGEPSLTASLLGCREGSGVECVLRRIPDGQSTR